MNENRTRICVLHWYSLAIADRTRYVNGARRKELAELFDAYYQLRSIHAGIALKMI